MRRFFFVALLALAPAAAAQDRTPTPSEILFRKGRELMEQGDAPAARARFLESLKLEPAVGTLLNLANCEEKLGQLAAALEHWKAALAAMKPDDERAAQARKRTAELEERVPRLTLKLAAAAPTTTRVRLDGVDVTASIGHSVPVDPGDHVLIASNEGFADGRFVVHAAERVATELDAAPGPAAVSTRLLSPSMTTTATATPRAPGRRYGAVIGLGAVTVALGIAGSVFLGLAKRDFDDLSMRCKPFCGQADADRVGTFESIGFALLGGGALTLATAVIIWAMQGAPAAAGGGASP
jgi:hypothetical protein